MFRNAFILLCVCTVTVVAYEIDLNENYHFDAHLSDDDTMIHFQVTVKTTGWIGFGVRMGSNAIFDSDLIMGGINDTDQTAYFSDMFGDAKVNETHPVDDVLQDWVIDETIPSSQNATHTILGFKRLLDTKDTEHDFEIKNEEIDVIWSYGNTDNTQYIHARRGSRYINLVTGVPRAEPTTESENESTAAASTSKSIMIFTSGVFSLLLFISL